MSKSFEFYRFHPWTWRYLLTDQSGTWVGAASIFIRQFNPSLVSNLNHVVHIPLLRDVMWLDIRVGRRGKGARSSGAASPWTTVLGPEHEPHATLGHGHISQPGDANVSCASSSRKSVWGWGRGCGSIEWERASKRFNYAVGKRIFIYGDKQRFHLNKSLGNFFTKHSL